MTRERPKLYKIIGAYDSETTNLSDGISKSAFPILHQLGLIDAPIETITPENVEALTRVRLYRHALGLFEVLDRICDAQVPWVPVICCHNLSFDMYGLASWLMQHEVRVLAKSQRKPISFTILDDEGKPRLVIWDTLVFAQKSLGYMGRECGYEKLVGSWDYDLVRTPQTPLTDDELAYASHDIYALLAWLGYWCRLNPDIDPKALGLRVVTKTGVVRTRRVQRFGKLKGKGLRKDVGHYWSFINSQNMFSTDDELYSCQAATRGGFTFCSKVNASRIFDYSKEPGTHIYGFDATSQHPSQMVSHRYPVRFQAASPENLTQAFINISLTTMDDVLGHYEKPFGVAFYGSFEFINLRPKAGSAFAKWGVMPLAWARCSEVYEQSPIIVEENQQGEEFRSHISELGYRDKVVGATHAFGKLESASKAILWITELTAWEICQAYDYDSVRALSGYLTLSFDKPSDMCVISVMQFYAAKNAFKKARGNYYKGKPLDNAAELKALGIPEFVISGMQDRSIEDSVIESTYLGLKADLNALFGIEACNEYRRDTVLASSGIEYTGEFGITNAPDHPKSWYQLGQRIVGWSRIAQCIVMTLCAPYVETCINGDTDSVKFVIRDCNLPKVEKALERLSNTIDKAKADVCSRVQRCYPGKYDGLRGIGYYVTEFQVDRYCASWNKAYCICEKDPRDSQDHIKFTLAGVPTKAVNKLADCLMSQGMGFGEICDTFLGYNVTYSHDLTGLNARAFPEWGSLYTGQVTDYQGHSALVAEPSALCLYPMAKTVNDEGAKENRVNMEIAMINRPSVNIEPLIITCDGIVRVGELINGE